jgi:hypothetical protein
MRGRLTLQTDGDSVGVLERVADSIYRNKC